MMDAIWQQLNNRKTLIGLFLIALASLVESLGGWVLPEEFKMPQWYMSIAKGLAAVGVAHKAVKGSIT